MKFFIILFFLAAIAFASDLLQDGDHEIILLAASKVGGTRNVYDSESRKEVMELLEKHLSQIKGSWELKEIFTITRQIVSGVNWYASNVPIWNIQN